MALKITKVAELIGEDIVISEKHGLRTVKFASLLTEFEPANPPGPHWALEIAIGKGLAKRDVKITLAPFLTPDQYNGSVEKPLLLKTDPELIIFRGRFFLAERRTRTEIEQEEVTLRAKKIIFDEEEEITSLKSYVSNVDAAVEFQKLGPKRDPISDDVKMLVWSRDGGACVRCGSKDKMHFDHIIPVAKGGSNLSENIQLLCQPCNLKKSDKIAF